MKIAYDKRIFNKKIIPEEVMKKFFPYRYKDLILYHAKEQNLDPYLVAGLILQESAFNSNARSRVGAGGLMQLMPNTAKWLARKVNIDISSESNGLYDPDLNVSLGTRYLKMLINEYPDKEYLALASYNAGSGNVKKW